MQTWAHLSQASMIKTTYVPYSPDATGDSAVHDCGGAHNNEFDDITNAGVSFPFTELDSRATSAGIRQNMLYKLEACVMGNIFH